MEIEKFWRVCEELLNWMENYLEGRQIRKIMRCFFVEETQVECLKGSVLSLINSVLDYVNDMLESL